MARKAIPKNETAEQTYERIVLDYFDKQISRSSRATWNRKWDKLVEIVAKVRPLEEKIQEIMAEKQVFLDEIHELRLDMVDACIHPKDQLIVEGNCVICKFCNAKIEIPSDVRQQA